MVKCNSTEPLRLETGAEGVVGHAGLRQMGQFVDQLGVDELWSQAFGPPGRGGRRHDRGRMLEQAALTPDRSAGGLHRHQASAGSARLVRGRGVGPALYRLLRSASEATVRRLTSGLAAVRAVL